MARSGSVWRLTYGGGLVGDEVEDEEADDGEDRDEVDGS